MVGVLLAAIVGLASPEKFEAAIPVWPAGEERTMNSFFRFRCEFEASGETILRASAAYDYKAKLNGEFVGFGPARAPKGFARVDQWPLKIRPGKNVLEIDSAGYNCNSYYLMNQTPFLVAEVVSGGKVIARTAPKGDFAAYETDRIRKAPRFGYQRTFMDVYRPGIALSDKAYPLAEIASPQWIGREVDYPDFAIVPTKPLRRGVWAKGAGRKFVSARFVDGSCPWLLHYPMNELETNPYYELQGYHTEKRIAIDGATKAREWHSLKSLETLVTKADRFEAGFYGIRVRAKTPCRVIITCDEILDKNGDIDFTRLDCAAMCEWRIQKAGEYAFESFEPMGSQYFETIVLDGEAEVTAPYVRTFKSPSADRATFKCSDEGLTKVFYAARESLRDNAVDAFTDCPAREHACWSGDTFFTARASHLLTGEGRIEKAFLSNFMMPERFDWSGYDTKGLDYSKTIPALYPGDIYRGNFISVFTMWVILQLDGYVQRTGDTAFAEASRNRLLGMLEFLDQFRNSDGLLEKLPGWIVIEWSEANKFGMDVNYIINMMYGAAKAACGRMYNRPDLTAEAAKIRGEIIRQSWNGEWFRDHSVRGKDGKLSTPDDISETCQYSAFYFGLVTPEQRPELWRRMLDDFGPERKTNGKHKKVWPSNLLFGTCMRMDLLSKAGRPAQAVAESRGWFLEMAETTGTLWEYLSTRASCCHGFPSIAANIVVRDALGVKSVDYLNKEVVFKPDPSVALDWCEGTLPLSRTDTASFSWRKVDGKLIPKAELPRGWKLKTLSATALIEFSTPSIALKFADANGGFALTSVVNRAAGDFAFIREKGKCDGLWRMTFKNGKTGRKVAITNRSKCRELAFDQTANALVLKWFGVDLPGALGAVDVTARVELDADDDRLTHWTIEATSNHPEWALFETDYPVVRSPLAANEGKVVVPSGNLGARYMDVVQNVTKEFFNSCPMISAFDCQGAGLYFCARDPEARIKKVVFMEENTVAYRTLVENAGVPGKAAKGPGYPVTLGVYQGDWWQAAKIHRKWALRQPWAQRGPLIEAEGYSRRMSEVPLWFNIHGGPNAVSNVLTKAHELFPDASAGIHWHLWQHSPHDVNYPEYFPEQVGTKETVSAMNAIGQVPMIYINGRRWSEHMQGFTFAKAYAVKDESGAVSSTWFKPAPPLASMCPYSPQWQGVVSNLSHRILTELKAPAIFIDEVGNEPCKPCFDSTHGHPVGGGRWWADGCRATLAPVQREYREAGAFVTTEGSTEALMDVVDGFLIVSSRKADEIPWYQAVYSGYATYFCSPSHQNDDAASFWMLQARELLRGIEIGWFYAGVMDEPEKVEMLRRLLAFRREHHDLLSYGELMDEFRPSEPLPMVKGAWRGRSTAPLQSAAPGDTFVMPAVIGNVWGSLDGSVKVLMLANLSDQQMTVVPANEGFSGAPVVIPPRSLVALRR